jgi:hypothetical protein
MLLVRTLLVVGVVGAVALSSPVAAAGAELRHASPGRYYLALGDSLTYGIQPGKVDAGLPPSGFETGFVVGAPRIAWSDVSSIPKWKGLGQAIAFGAAAGAVTPCNRPRSRTAHNCPEYFGPPRCR